MTLTPMRMLNAVLAAAAVAAVAFGAGIAPAVPGPTFNEADFLKVLATIAMLALFVERTIEVTIGVWRGQAAARLQATAENARAALVSNPANIALHETVSMADRELVDHRAGTRKAALRAAVVIGIALAAAGVRVLEGLVTPQDAQANGLLRLLDILITGAAIGGGSEPIHKIMSLVTMYFDAAAGNVRAAEKSSGAIATGGAIPPLTPGAPR